MLMRKDYVAGAHSHREYYGQFVTPAMVDIIGEQIGSKLLKSTNVNFNDIPLAIWAKPYPPQAVEALRRAGDIPTVAGRVCLWKEAARQWVEKQESKVS